MSRTRMSSNHGFIAAAACIIAGTALGYGLSYPLQFGLDFIAVKLCDGSKDRVLVSYKDKIFIGQTKIACIPRKFA